MSDCDSVFGHICYCHGCQLDTPNDPRSWPLQLWSILVAMHLKLSHGTGNDHLRCGGGHAQSRRGYVLKGGFSCPVISHVRDPGDHICKRGPAWARHRGVCFRKEMKAMSCFLGISERGSFFFFLLFSFFLFFLPFHLGRGNVPIELKGLEKSTLERKWKPCHVFLGYQRGGLSFINFFFYSFLSFFLSFFSSFPSKERQYSAWIERLREVYSRKEMKGVSLHCAT